ncbi:tRNA (adenine(22)-N(1))-methyltransferase [Planctomycetes bacterium K23_9]|uniref:tRNA (Adenine(22)-N(1))-methyltransferase n=1 Tax=Stieleria marina TaxID=1930275 RepID=A0A517NNK3_9BACT|nr:tRNA (adenine(22)-N(1))-methyltransferase [Planctomycetes bacterium K23_9]
MPKLDIRLKTVARMIRDDTHADVGSDHGHLLFALLKSGRIQRGIAIENKQQPFANSSHRLAGVNADVRLGDGLSVLHVGEADSLSICGMGAKSMVRILEGFPDRVPTRVIMQPNCEPELVRGWGLRSGYHIETEQIAWGHLPYQVVCLRRADSPDDAAYEDVDHDAALLFGPTLVKRRDPDLFRQLSQERAYYRELGQLTARSAERLKIVETLLRIGPKSEI